MRCRSKIPGFFAHSLTRSRLQSEQFPLARLQNLKVLPDLRLHPIAQTLVSAIETILRCPAEFSADRLHQLGQWVGHLTRLSGEDLAHDMFHLDFQTIANRRRDLAAFLMDNFLSALPPSTIEFSQKTEAEKDLLRLLAIVKVRGEPNLQDSLLQRLSLSPRPAARAALIAHLNAFNAALCQELGQRKTTDWFCAPAGNIASPEPAALKKVALNFPNTTFKKTIEQLEGFGVRVSTFSSSYQESTAEISELVFFAIGAPLVSWLTGWGTSIITGIALPLGIIGVFKALTLWARRGVIASNYPTLRFDHYTSHLATQLKFYFDRRSTNEKCLVVLQLWIDAMEHADPLCDGIPTFFKFTDPERIIVSYMGGTFSFSKENFMQSLTGLKSRAKDLGDLIETGHQLAAQLAEPLPHKKARKSSADYIQRCLQNEKDPTQQFLDQLMRNPTEDIETGLYKWLQTQPCTQVSEEDLHHQMPHSQHFFDARSFSRLRQQVLHAHDRIKQHFQEYQRYFGFHARARIDYFQTQMNLLEENLKGCQIAQNAAFWNPRLQHPDGLKETLQRLSEILNAIFALDTELESKLSLIPSPRPYENNRSFYTSLILQYFE